MQSSYNQPAEQETKWKSNQKITLKLRNSREYSKFIGWGRVEGFVNANGVGGVRLQLSTGNDNRWPTAECKTCRCGELGAIYFGVSLFAFAF